MADRIERICAHWSALWIFTALFAFGVRVNIDVTNIAISYFTCALLLLSLGPSRRDRKAVHAKLDDLECAIEQADSENRRLEELTEIEIEERRNNGTPSDT